MKDRKNLIVKLLIGIPASGKSTWTKEFILNNPNYLRINRDDFRLMLKNQQICEPKIENMITELVYNAIDVALSNKFNILLDNTHVKARYLNDIINHVQYHADVEFQIFDISLDKAIERDKNRDKSVGAEVITKMYKDYKILMDSYIFQNYPKKNFIYKEPTFVSSLPKAVIFDVDGTLSHVNGKRGYFDWHKVDRDDLDMIVFDAYNVYKASGREILVCTGRSEEAREKTELWLNTYGIQYSRLFMRKADDFRPDIVVKKEIYTEEIMNKYNIEVIFEDRQPVVDMWRSIGLKVFQVHKGV